MGIPQILIILWMGLALGINLAKDGEKTEYDGLAAIITFVVLFFMLFWGGFFS